VPPLILLVEDDPTLQILGKSQFKVLGFDVDIAGSGEDAIAKTKENRYSLIFMDISMPGMSGIEATLHIRESELRAQQPRTPIIAMTAYSQRQEALGAGMDAFVQKPVLLDVLTRLCLQWLPPDHLSAKLRGEGV